MTIRTIIVSILFLFIQLVASANVQIRYFNMDQTTYQFEVKIGNKTTTVEFGANRTTSLTIPGHASECTVHTSCGDVVLKNGSQITILNGCIKVD